MDLLDARTVTFALAIAGLLGALSVGYYLVRHLRRSMVEPDEVTPDEVLDALRQAYEDGEMDSSEFRRIQEVARREGAARAAVAGKGEGGRSAPVPRSLPAGSIPDRPDDGAGPAEGVEGGAEPEPRLNRGDGADPGPGSG